MARKRTKAAPAPADGDKRPVNIKLSPAHHKMLRMIAADMETSMSEYASMVVVKAIEAHASREG